MKHIDLEILQMVGGYDLGVVILPTGCHMLRPRRKHIALVRGTPHPRCYLEVFLAAAP